MTDSFQPSPQPQANPDQDGLRTLTHVLYALYAVHWLTGGLTSVIALIINYVKRGDAVGTPYEDHFTWQIRSFWISLITYGVGFATAIFGVGFLILGFAWIWSLYRIIKGWLYLYDGKPLDARAWY